jgi:hypothetical protein
MAETASPKSRAPRRGSDAFDCPRCGAYAHQTWYDLKREIFDNYEQEHWTVDAIDSGQLNPLSGLQESLSDPETSDTKKCAPIVGAWAMSQCGRCEEYSTWRDDSLMYPAGSSNAQTPHEDMPDEAKALYREAAAVVGISRRAGAALARATLERLLRLLDPMEKNPSLADRIDHVTPKATRALAKMLTVIRHTGNKSLHVDDEPDDVMLLILDPEEEQIVDLIFASINGLVEELVTRPREVDAIYGRIPEHIRDAVRKRSG